MEFPKQKNIARHLTSLKAFHYEIECLFLRFKDVKTARSEEDRSINVEKFYHAVHRYLFYSLVRADHAISMDLYR